MKVCGGLIGAKKNNNCFCCVVVDRSQDKDCSVGRHKVHKHVFTSDSRLPAPARIYYHKGTSSNVAFAHPFVDAKHLSVDTIASVLGKVYGTWEEWRDDALVLEAAVESKQGAAAIRTAVKAARQLPRLDSGEEAKGASQVDWDMDIGKRLKLLAFSVESLMELDKLVALKEDDLPTSSEFLSEYNSIRERINLLHQALIEMSQVTTSSMRELHLGLALRIAGVEAMLGAFSSQEMKSTHEGSSLADVVEDIQAQLDALKVHSISSELAERVVNSDAMKQQTEGIKEAFRLVVHRIQALEVREEARHQDSNAQGLDANWLGATPTGSGVGHNSREIGGVPWQVVNERLNRLEQALESTSHTEGEDVTVSFMGIRFVSEDEVRSYFESINNGRYDIPMGLVLDCYSIFYTLNREIFAPNGKLSLIDLAKVGNLGMRQGDVYNLLAAAEHGLPDFFDAPASTNKIYIDGKQGKKSRFGNIASYEIWGPVGTIKDSIRKRAETSISRLIRNKRAAITTEVNQPEIRAFLISMLDRSKEFVEAVFNFMTEEFSALSEHFNNEVLCWDFACSCVEHVFKHEFEAARSIVNNPDVNDVAIGSKVMWQSLRTIAVQEAFMRVGFKNHSSLSSAYSRFLLTQYQRTAQELEKVSKEEESNKRKIGELSSTIDALDKRVRAAEGTASAANNAMQKLSKSKGNGGGSS
jgi:hypothetical protein